MQKIRHRRVRNNTNIEINTKPTSTHPNLRVTHSNRINIQIKSHTSNTNHNPHINHKQTQKHKYA